MPHALKQHVTTWKRKHQAGLGAINLSINRSRPPRLCGATFRVQSRSRRITIKPPGAVNARLRLSVQNKKKGQLERNVIITPGTVQKPGPSELHEKKHRSYSITTERTGGKGVSPHVFGDSTSFVAKSQTRESSSFLIYTAQETDVGAVSGDPNSGFGP